MRWMQPPLAVPELNYQKETGRILRFIRKTVQDANAMGVVIGLSGGVDSSLAATLCVRALGKDNVLGILMPTSFTPPQDNEDAKALASQLGMHTKHVNIDRICSSFFTDLQINAENSFSKMPAANIRARVRMIILYYHANRHKYLVVGTSDRSEALIGFFTKYGDGGADFLPIIHLYKTQVRRLAEYLKHIAYKPSSPQLYPGHMATDEIPIDYERLDRILVGLFDLKLTPSEVSKLTGDSVETVGETLRRFSISKHKRAFPPNLSRPNCSHRLHE